MLPMLLTIAYHSQRTLGLAEKVSSWFSVNTSGENPKNFLGQPNNWSFEEMSLILLTSLTSLEFSLRNRFKYISALTFLKPIRAIPLKLCGRKTLVKRATRRKSFPCPYVVNLEW